MYRVCAGNDVHAWGPFSSICRTEIPCGRTTPVLHRDADTNTDFYPASTFGLSQQDLTQEDYLERSVLLIVGTQTKMFDLCMEL